MYVHLFYFHRLLLIILQLFLINPISSVFNPSPSPHPQHSAATSLAPPCWPWPPGSSCWFQAEGRDGSVSWSFPTSTNARVSRPTTHQSKRWPSIRLRTASSADRLRATSGYYWLIFLSSSCVPKLISGSTYLFNDMAGEYMIIY